MNRHYDTTMGLSNAARAVRPLWKMKALLWAVVALFLSLSTGCAPDGGSSGSSSATSGGSGGTPEALRSYEMNFLPSESQIVDGYEISLGEVSGTYDTVIDVPISSTTDNGNLLTYALNLESGREYFIVLRAYNAGGFSGFSNEFRVGAAPSAVGSISREAPTQVASVLTHSPTSTGTTPLASNATVGTAVGTLEADQINAAEAVAETDSGTDHARDSDENENAVERDVATSLEFDGEGEYLASTQRVALGIERAFSLSLWLRPALDDAERRTLLDLRDVAGDANRLTLSVVNIAGIEMTLHGANGSVLHSALYEDVLLDAAWQHLTLVLDRDFDLEPRLYLDAQRQLANESASTEGPWEMTDTPRRIVMGANMTDPDDSYRGHLGHAAMWNVALPDSVIEEVSTGGHETDLRFTGLSENAPENLTHYWRLGADTEGIGFDHGSASTPIDLDDTSGGVDDENIVSDAPTAL